MTNNELLKIVKQGRYHWSVAIVTLVSANSGRVFDAYQIVGGDGPKSQIGNVYSKVDFTVNGQLRVAALPLRNCVPATEANVKSALELEAILLRHESELRQARQNLFN